MRISLANWTMRNNINKFVRGTLRGKRNARKTNAMKNKISLWKIESQHSFHLILDHLEMSGYVRHKNDKNWAMLLKNKEPDVVSWNSFVLPLLDPTIDGPKSSNSSFVYVLTVNDSIYALTGGYGHTAISKFIDCDFGLNVAIRMIDDVNDINALNQSAFKGPIRQQFRTVENYNLLSDRENFDKLLKFVQAKAKFQGADIIIAARSNFCFRSESSIDEIEQIIEDIEEQLSQPIKIDIPKSYKVVTNSAEILLLEESLVQDFSAFWNGNSSRDSLYAEFDDPIVQFSSEKFVFKTGSGRNEKKFELISFDLDQISDENKNSLGLLSRPITKSDLEKIYVYGVNSDGIQQGGSSLYNMLAYDVKLANSDFVKMGKKWYRIDQFFVDNLDSYLASIQTNLTDLVPWSRAQFPLEYDYNDHIALSKNGLCYDQDCVRIGHQQIEFCDVFLPDTNRLYHIKQTWGAKSSYLFLQGATALDYYENNEEFRNACANKWATHFANRLAKGVLVYGIGIDQSKIADFPKNLTFFAKLNLVDACKKIKALQWNVELSPFPVS